MYPYHLKLLDIYALHNHLIIALLALVLTVTGCGHGEPDELAEAAEPLIGTWTGDLDGMIERRQVRVLVPYSRTFYFLDERGSQRAGRGRHHRTGEQHPCRRALPALDDRSLLLREPFDKDNRLLFALASYNAGPRRVREMRREAEATGLDPNVWFDNVEFIAARRIGRETVEYVANIYKYHIAFRLVSEGREIAVFTPEPIGH
jgi:hypothetical protein